MVDLDVAVLIEQQQIKPSIACCDAGEHAFVGNFDEFIDQLSGGDVADLTALLKSR